MSDKPEITMEFIVMMRKAIAKAMGEEWTLVTDDDGDRWSFEIRRADGAECRFEVNARERRFHVFGAYPTDRGAYLSPRGWGVDGRPPSINLTIDKAPSRIVSDLRGRFLPDYLRMYAECVRAAKDRESYRATTLETATRLATIIGGVHWGSDPGHLHVDGEGTISGVEWRMRAEVTGDHVAVTVKANAALIESMLRMLTRGSSSNDE